jgi:hypothetical protein
VQGSAEGQQQMTLLCLLLLLPQQLRLLAVLQLLEVLLWQQLLRLRLL